MQGLSKMPEERPASAGAFTEMLAARAQTGPEFFKQAVLMYLEHARAFLSASLIGPVPGGAAGASRAAECDPVRLRVRLVPAAGGPSVVVAAMMLTLGPGMLFVQGSVVPAVMQAVVSPLQPIDVRTLRRRFHPRFLSYVRAVAPFLWLFVITGLWQLPARSWAQALRPLVRDSNPRIAIPSALATAFLPILPLFAMTALLYLHSGSAKAMRYLASVAVVEGLSPQQSLGALGAARASGRRRARRARRDRRARHGSRDRRRPQLRPAERVAAGRGRDGDAGACSSRWHGCDGPVLRGLNALTYSARARSSGEPLDKALAEFERAVLPESHWKLAERERVATLIASRW
jgi:hypothetical protein